MKNAEAKLLMATNRWIEDQNAKHCLFTLPIFRGRRLKSLTRESLINFLLGSAIYLLWSTVFTVLTPS